MRTVEQQIENMQYFTNMRCPHVKYINMLHRDYKIYIKVNTSGNVQLLVNGKVQLPIATTNNGNTKTIIFISTVPEGDNYLIKTDDDVQIIDWKEER